MDTRPSTGPESHVMAGFSSDQPVRPALCYDNGHDDGSVSPLIALLALSLSRARPPSLRPPLLSSKILVLSTSLSHVHSHLVRIGQLLFKGRQIRHNLVAGGLMHRHEEIADGAGGWERQRRSQEPALETLEKLLLVDHTVP